MVDKVKDKAKDKDTLMKYKYANSLVSLENCYDKKTSDIDLSDRAQVATHAQIGIQDKQLLDESVREYQGLNVKIIGQIKTHLNHMQKRFIEKEVNVGALSFLRPSLYLSSVVEEEIQGELSITTANDYLAYSFLMFRMVSGSKAYNFQPDYVVSFKKGSTDAYSNYDLINTFKYTQGGSSLEAFVTTKDNKKAPNPEAWKILKEDKVEVEGILKNTFTEYAHACNLLKETNDQNARLVCINFSDYSSPDYFLELHTCLEIFNLAKNLNLCLPVAYAEFDWDL